MVRALYTATKFAVFLWTSAALAVPHGLSRSARPRSDSDVQPFLITIKPYHMGLNTSTTAAKPQNISAYFLGDAPNPANPAQQLGFITQHADDGTTTYFMPPTNAQPGEKIAAGPNLSWKLDDDDDGISFKTPGTVTSGRIYIVDGYLDFSSQSGLIAQPDPHNSGDIASQEIWGFIELTHAKGSSDGNEDMTVNLSFVDWVSLPLGMNVTFQEGNDQKTVYIPGLKPDGLVRVCGSLSSLDSFWPKLCLRAPDNTPLRVMSPEKYMSLYPNDQDAANYYEPYINQVWEKYKSVDLVINTQTDGPDSNKKVDDGQKVTCRVGQSDDILHCDSDAGDFHRPVSRDIYGCNSGPFENPSNGAAESWSRARARPRLCAAFARSTLHLDGAQPSHGIGPDQYYKVPVTNHYARVVHENLVGGMGYAFSYDDVNPGSAENSAGLVSMTRPLRLDIFINM